MEGAPSGRQYVLEYDQRGELMNHKEVPQEIGLALVRALGKQKPKDLEGEIRVMDYGSGVIEYIATMRLKDSHRLARQYDRERDILVISIRIENGKVESTAVRSRPSWFKE